VTADWTLEVEQLRFRYAGAEVDTLQGVTLSVHEGQSLGILGPNGAGKSTLIGALVGTLDGTTSGTVTLNGSRSYPLAHFGFASQDVALYPTLTVRENIQHVARLTVGKERTRQLTDQVVDEFDLGTIVDRPVHQLSGGQMRIAHLATSVVHRPAVLMLDEPTNGLDFEVRQRLLSLVQGWREEGRLVIVTSHYPEDIEEMCTDLVLIKEGRSIELGRIGEFTGSHEQSLHVQLVVDGNREQVQLEPTSASLADMAKEIERLVDMTPSASVSSVSFNSSLRSVLRADPSFRSYVADVAPEQET
jgi:ABC-2 type transport system ATP-binding protein